jgi:hypothetical protein
MSPPRRSRGPKGATAGEGGARPTQRVAFSLGASKDAEA